VEKANRTRRKIKSAEPSSLATSACTVTMSLVSQDAELPRGSSDLAKG
jgi:hypothetical protein